MVTRIPIASNNMPNQHNYMLFGHICPCNTKVRMIHTHLSVTLQFSVPRSFVSRINLGKTRNSGRLCLTNQAKRSLESALGAAMLLLYQRNQQILMHVQKAAFLHFDKRCPQVMKKFPQSLPTKEASFMAYSNFTAAKIRSKNHHWLMINTEYVRVKMSKCLSSFVQATAVHFFSVKLLKKKSSKGIKQAHETWFRFYCHKQNQQRRFPTFTSCDHLFCEFLLNSLMISNNVIILEKQRTPFHFSIIVMHDTSVPE